MDMLRITARWTGFSGAPGYSNFFFAAGGGFIGDENQVAQRTRNAINELRDVLPTSVTVAIEPESALIDSDTGMIAEYRDVETTGPVVGIGAGPYSAASGAVVNWRTADLRFGRRIRGRTFLVPLSGSAYEDDGTLSVDGRASVQAFADEMVGGDLDSEFGVWSRPRNGAGGVFATAISANVPDMAAVLRSRRD